MRLNIMVLVLLSSTASAQAGSIDAITTSDKDATSIEKISCSGCVTRAMKKAEPVVELAPGTQKIEIREVDGVKKIYRTEAWLGGSPVVYVSKAFPDDSSIAVADEQPVKTDDVAAAPDVTIDRPAVPVEADMIDEKATTSAVTADTGAEIKVEVAPKAIAFDPGKLELRLN